MNREIKFRFWLGHTEKMTFEHELFEVGKIILEQTGDIIPMQNTGLKDKNSVEIYEGDVIKWVWDCGSVEIERVENSLNWDGTLSPSSAPFMSAWGSTCGKYFRTFMNIYDPTRYAYVIGNIHQHPHLLQEATSC